MKKFVLIFLFIQSIVYSQANIPVKMAIAPNCKSNLSTQEQVLCFNKFTTDGIKQFFNISNNLFLYFRITNFSEKANFRVDELGYYSYLPKEDNSPMFNDIATNSFLYLNHYLAEKSLKIIPAKNKDGENVPIYYRIPLTYVQTYLKKSDVNKNPILFTIKADQRYIVRLNPELKFMIYDEQNKFVRKVEHINDFYSDEILNRLTLETKHLVVEKNINGIDFKIEVENIFRNQSKVLTIMCYENGKLMKVYNGIQKFIDSKYSKHIY